MSDHLIRHVLNTVYREFHSWEFEYSLQAIRSLSKPPSTPNVKSKPKISEKSRQNASLFCEIVDFEPTTTTCTVKSVDIIQIPRRLLLQPTPAYESSPLIPRSRMTGDDPSNMPFIPMADDVNFDWQDHCKNYKTFAWQTSMKNPDLDVVLLEAARRLNEEHGISYESIDASGIFPEKLLTGPGLLIRASRRDMLPWPPGQRHPSPPPQNLDAQKEFSNMVSMFCSNLNCICGFCNTHVEASPLPIAGPSSEPFPTRTRATPCGTDCFQLAENADKHDPDWDSETNEVFTTVVDFSSDISPCDLAVICRKPCYAVFPKQQLHINQRAKINRAAELSDAKTRKGKRPMLVFEDANPSLYTPNEPCAHDGPCDATSQCSCFINKTHCEFNCRCNPTSCKRRWQGCNCSKPRGKRQRVCGRHCPCFKALRECDPTLCGKCGVKDARDVTSDTCRNCSIQRGIVKKTEVRRSEWGFGLFLLEPVGADEFITEYTGELIFEATTDSRDDVTRHRGRNYLFDLNTTLAIDASYGANEARYINHYEKANCKASVLLVNGEHRIGIHAKTDVAAGQEMFINYGDGDMIAFNQAGTFVCPIARSFCFQQPR